MKQTKTWGWVLLCLLLIGLPVFAQESAVKGNVSGVIQDSTGAVVPGAKVTLTGPQGERALNSESDGKFTFSLLTPGMYSVKVEKQGFRATEVKGIEVAIGRTTSLSLKLEPGAVSEVIEVTGAATTVDTTTTAVGANLADTFYQQVPVARNVASLFYVAPGAADSGGAGHSNPSISGASGLENLYMADGVNITDSAFGGLGVFTRRQGSIGSGINLSFIKEVNVKTGGFEPQYGQATGGVVQLVTKSGTSQYHGELGLYAAPQGAEATYLQTDAVRTNLVGNFLHRANFDVDGEFGGPVPGFKNRLFFFGSFNPAWAQQFVSAPPSAGLAALGTMTLFARTWNYAGKLTFKINDSNQLESSVFGDPTKTNTGEQNYVLNTPNDTAMSRWDYGTRNWVVRYNGTLSPSWLVNGSFTWNNSRFNEIPKFDVTQITDRTVSTNIHPLQGFGFLENHHTDSYALNVDTSKVFHGAGEHTISVGYRYERPDYTDFKTSSGPAFATPATNFNDESYLTCTPGDFGCPLGATSYVWAGGLRVAPAGCTQCPLYPVAGVPTPVYVRYGRGEFDPSKIPTYGRYHAAYINDAWQMNKYITLSLGMRWEQWKMQGTFSGYTFTDNWAPRVGVAIDPWGDRKTKIYGNFGRYNYQTPLDASIRSLSAERDVLNLAFAPQADASNNVIINPNGSINMIFDSAHLLNQSSTSTGGGIPITPSLGVSFTGFAPGTKLMYQDEYVVGTDHEFKNGLVLSGRFIYRRLGRTLDDVSGVSPEAYNFGFTQNYFIANPSPKLDLFPNANEQVMAPGVFDPVTNPNSVPATCAGANPKPPTAPTQQWQYPVLDANGGSLNPATGAPWANGGVCYTPNADGNYGGEVHINGFSSSPWPDGIPDGFPLPTHIYKAVEIEANKSLSHNWMMRANWRIASLFGNYEGAFRNDNGQTDPNISSLFDFTNGILGMLGDQYKPGPLNTDRRHIVNIYFTYVVPSGFLKALELGGGVNILGGTPITNLADHPAYGNQGEVPLGGRGLLGRTAVSGGVNLHADKPFSVSERFKMHLTADLFNVTNSKVVTNVDQFSQLNFNPAANPDFQKVQAWSAFGPGPGYIGYQRPFYARFSARLTF
jgi:hypothetical protein